MSSEMEIGGQEARVRIEVLGYENPTAQNSSDANWLACRVEIRVRSFGGRIDAAFTTQDFRAFSKSLRAALADAKGEAAFETDEDAFRLRVAFTVAGTARVSGTLREPDRPQTALTFSFESDQTFLRCTAEALDQITLSFPVQER